MELGSAALKYLATRESVFFFLCFYMHRKLLTMVSAGGPFVVPGEKPFSGHYALCCHYRFHASAHLLKHLVLIG